MEIAPKLPFFDTEIRWLEMSLVLQFFLSAAFLLGVGNTMADENVIVNFSAAKVDEILTPLTQAGSPGVAVGIIHKGEVVLRRGYGSADLEHGVPITPSTIFQSASVSKQFTAFAVAMLAKQGKLSLDDEIRKYLPAVPRFAKPITIRQVIHHTSGLRDQWELLFFAGWRMEDVVTQRQVLDLAERQQRLNFEPGTEFRYTNTGYTLLASIVERVTGQSFGAWMQDNIFRPLSMNDSFVLEDHREIIPNRAYSYYTREDGDYGKAMAPHSTVGATNLFTTVDDLLLWSQNVEEGTVGGKELITQTETVGTLNDGENLNYAYGLIVGSHRGMKTIGHGGGHAGFRSYVVRIPEAELAIVILANLQSIHPHKLAYEIADMFIGGEPIEQEALIPRIEEGAIDPNLRDSYLGTYLVAPGYALTIRQSGQGMTIRSTGEDESTMQYVSPGNFYVENYATAVNFIIAEEGSSMTLQIQGLQAPRVEAWVPTQQELQKFTGRYYSEELRVIHELLVSDGQLILDHPRRGSEPLHPTVTDQFGEDMADDFGITRPWFRGFDFERGNDGQIFGYQLSAGGAENVWFERTSDL